MASPASLFNLGLTSSLAPSSTTMRTFLTETSHRPNESDASPESSVCSSSVAEAQNTLLETSEEMTQEELEHWLDNLVPHMRNIGDSFPLKNSRECEEFAKITRTLNRVGNERSISSSECQAIADMLKEFPGSLTKSCWKEKFQPAYKFAAAWCLLATKDIGEHQKPFNIEISREMREAMQAAHKANLSLELASNEYLFNKELPASSAAKEIAFNFN